MDAFGYVACTGTNFCLRARALAAVGWFPTYTITEGECVVFGGMGRPPSSPLPAPHFPLAPHDAFRV